MSYTVHQEPLLYQPAYNDLIFVVSSSNNGQTNFNYFADIYIGGDVIRLKAPANPIYGSGVFNFGRIVESYVNTDLDLTMTASGFIRNANSYQSYYIKFGEEYGSTVVQYADITTTVTKYVWNGVLDFLAFQNFNFTSYSLDGTGNTLNKVIERNIQTSQNAWEYYFANDVTAATYAIINTYNSAGALLQHVAVTNPYQTSGTIGDHFVRFACGTNQLNSITSGSIVAGAQPIITGSVASYDIAFSDSTTESGAYDSESNTYNIVDADCKYSTFRLHFLNELGAFESFNFTKLSRKSIDVTKNDFKSVYGALSSATAFSYSKSDRLKKNFFTSMSEKIKLKTDWLTDAEHVYLQELLTSPEIYLDDTTHGLIAVSCNATKIDVKTRLNDKLFNLEVDIEYSFNRYRQRH